MVVAVAKRPVGFVVQLRLKQRQLGLRDIPFARLLGMDRTRWYRLRTAERQVTLDLVQRAVTLWPEDFKHLGLEHLLRPERNGNGNGGEQTA